VILKKKEEVADLEIVGFKGKPKIKLISEDDRKFS